ncbi:hypothetical protein VN1328_06630 [Helicobacter pylori]
MKRLANGKIIIASLRVMVAINKLLETKKGFVAGAFYKEGLGDIDLVWGNKDYGLEHIIPNIISDGKLSKDVRAFKN